MKYVKQWFCVNCKKRMSWDTRMYSHGCCPMCGHMVSSTICDTFEKQVLVKSIRERIETWIVNKLG
jgi:transcription initiation factor IIE alpha subunit